MDRQKRFIEMMGALIGKSIQFENKIFNDKDNLELNCEKLSKELDTPLKIDMDSCCEPCPFCCSSIDKPFDFVFVGLNPGKVLESYKKSLNFSWQDTTWQDLADFCVPTNDIRYDENNIYHFLKKGKSKSTSVESPYYKFFLRFHMALVSGEIYDSWGKLGNKYKYLKKLFIERFATYSILNAELIPYKYRKVFNFNVENLIDDENYRCYFQNLIQFIETETKPDAWIIFFGKQPKVKILFDNFAPHWIVPDANLHLHFEANKYNHFHLFNRGQQKILLSPFIQPGRSSLYKNIKVLVDELKKFEKTVI